MQAKIIHNGSDNGDKIYAKIRFMNLTIFIHNFCIQEDQFYQNLNKSTDTANSKNNEINLSSENMVIFIC